MVTWHRRGATVVMLCAWLAIAGCAQSPLAKPDASPEQRSWRGRLSVSVQATPPSSMTASFELSGNADAGELLLSGPLGNTVARVAWSPRHASIDSRGETRQHSSLQDLLKESLGVELPMAALFAWLRGDDMPALGWQTELSQLGSGRLTARRMSPEPVAELRLILEP